MNEACESKYKIHQFLVELFFGVFQLIITQPSLLIMQNLNIQKFSKLPKLDKKMFIILSPCTISSCYFRNRLSVFFQAATITTTHRGGFLSSCNFPTGGDGSGFPFVESHRRHVPREPPEFDASVMLVQARFSFDAAFFFFF